MCVHWMCYADNESQLMYTNLCGLSCYQLITPSFSLLPQQSHSTKTTFYDDPDEEARVEQGREHNNSSLWDFMLLMTLISKLQSLGIIIPSPLSIIHLYNFLLVYEQFSQQIRDKKTYRQIEKIFLPRKENMLGQKSASGMNH